MSTSFEIIANLRDRAGKGAARAVRRQGLVPAVLYGDKKPASNLTLDPRQIFKALETGRFFSTVYEIKIGRKKERALARDVQFHPVTDQPLHVDFLRLSGDTKINVMVVVNFMNEDKSAGLKEGGLLNIVRHEVELIVPSDDIPQQIDVDLTPFQMGDTINFSTATLPKTATPAISDRDFVLATIAAPRAAVAVAEEEETEETEAPSET